MATIWNARRRVCNDLPIRSETPRTAARGWPLSGLAAAVALLAAGERPASAAQP